MSTSEDEVDDIAEAERMANGKAEEKVVWLETVIGKRITLRIYQYSYLLAWYKSSSERGRRWTSEQKK